MDFVKQEDSSGHVAANKRAAKEENLQTDRDRHLPTPFKGSFPLEVLTKIIFEVHIPTLATCLRVSKEFFHIAGSILYADIVMRDPERLMQGAEITNERAEVDKGEDGKSKEKEERSKPRTNFERQLLKYVKTIVVRAHHCPQDRARQSALTNAARTMTGLEQIILVPKSDFMSTFPLCEDESACALLAGLKSRSITIHNVQIYGHDDVGPVAQFDTILHEAQHVTLIIPPTSFYITAGGVYSSMSGQPLDLAWPTRHCESVRLIAGITERELRMEDPRRHYPLELTKLAALQHFLASFIDLNFTKMEIYIFNNFDNILDLPKFKEEPAVTVDKHFEESIKTLTEEKILDPKYENWKPDYQVFGLEDYFAIPTLYHELDDGFINDWWRELSTRNRARLASMNASQEPLADLEEEISDSDSVDAGVAVGDEGEAKAVGDVGDNEDGQGEENGEKDLEERRAKKARI